LISASQPYQKQFSFIQDTAMLIRIGYDIRFELAHEVPFLAVLRVHPSRQADLRSSDAIRTSPAIPVEEYKDVFGNLCGRLRARPGELRLQTEAIIEDSGLPDPVAPDAPEISLMELPSETLRFLLASRYCEVDLLSSVAFELFSNVPAGWARVQAICNWVNTHVAFDYAKARATKTALDVYTERVGVCRDFQHLAITFCRALNIPARYATGYLGDIGIPRAPFPMDFSAWFEAWLGDRWWTFDARHNRPRIGRILMATGRDAVDVAITTSFGQAGLTGFSVVSDEI
jgi:transglutaminase-like putative cysteine protease